jgi:hypothetical protein
MPALQNTFLFIEPQQHYLDYGSVVLHDIVSKNRRAGQIITELIGDDANPDRVKQELNSLLPIVTCGIGHGNETTYTVECTALLFNTSSTDLNLVADKIISLCSCLTAVELGPAIIAAGAVVYTGYNQEFWFYTGDNPGTTRAVQSPFLAEFQFAASLLQGKTTNEARQDQLKQYDAEIDYWITGDGKNHPDADELSRMLETNKADTVFLGQGSIQPSKSAPTILVGGTTPLLWIGMAATVVFLIYKEVKRKS